MTTENKSLFLRNLVRQNIQDRESTKQCILPYFGSNDTVAETEMAEKQLGSIPILLKKRFLLVRIRRSEIESDSSVRSGLVFLS